MLLHISIDDGHELDVKSIKLLDKYGLTGLFFIPVSSWGFRNPEVYVNHVVGSHTINHNHNTHLLPQDIHFFEVAYSRYCLQKQFGQSVEWFCPPRGRFSAETVLMCEFAGYKVLRTTKVSRSGWNYDGIVQDTAIHVYPRKEYGDTTWLEVAKVMISADPQVFHLWFHSDEVERLDEWDRLEEFFKYVTKLGISNNESSYRLGI